MSEFVKTISMLDLGEMAKAEETLAGEGMTLVDVMNKLFRQINEYGCAPVFCYDDRSFNGETLEALREADDIKAGRTPAKVYDSVREAFQDALSGDDGEDA